MPSARSALMEPGLDETRLFRAAHRGGMIHENNTSLALTSMTGAQVASSPDGTRILVTFYTDQDTQKFVQLNKLLAAISQKPGSRVAVVHGRDSERGRGHREVTIWNEGSATPPRMMSLTEFGRLLTSFSRTQPE